MKRPVLYHVLYQNMEKSATTPPGSVSEADRHLEPWVLEICRDSIESAKLIILVLASQSRHLSGGLPASSRLPLSPLHEDQSSPSYLSWTDVQLLVGAYALLLSVQTAASFSFAFREITEIGEILDSAEDVLSGISSQSSGYADTLEILTNIRHTFQNSTPLAGL
ncbi:hypothetical protein N7462_009567 [Penicillium macrosclerotiorum]|uniref:uncharacterized protein n=1 Tax=Penicillium macrosclerotiorum TaxID=303699 RepID=UPI0025467818|nr:uncharacterized protein N7462_009567 [Penicillium macrosclerotiorum]KAJ5674128.1 hypothetical protein N7462_009567 [Penicillium macrosclerotiorum]